jgi:hypothetical protein
MPATGPVVERVAEALQRCDFDDIAEADHIWRTSSDAYRDDYRLRARAAIRAARPVLAGRRPKRDWWKDAAANPST